MDMEGFFRLHDGLPREGPGCDGDVEWAVAKAGMAGAARVLDAGSGPGGDVTALRRAMPGAKIVAVDSHTPFIDTLNARFAGDPKVNGVVGDMMVQDGPFDLIWSAGAIYFIGVTEALTGWRQALAPVGVVAFSQACLFRPDPPEAVNTLFEGYPITDAAGISAQVVAAGYKVLASRPVGDTAWETYYQPQEARIAELWAAGGIDQALQVAIDEAEQEIAIWRTHRADFGYQLFVVEPA
ncbi:class I SAM-dependent methyltransferase [Alisedimentitalea sp. MJ-SS2]|uniref:class I SAM-dependent methyltransferase n=1 Tax=Aliisedimentitalea sp. MJ-SS2 TaxID=3049795 RepID=UPI00290D896E|nr:class I SAM-dependent methyltransferase [Alisedimentitalea sp. MJ-SS2]MDU8926653.1 class I SAM-dependent methyltransferase [Alisedimentitalea sp. MJ-SS2]